MFKIWHSHCRNVCSWGKKKQQTSAACLRVACPLSLCGHLFSINLPFRLCFILLDDFFVGCRSLKCCILVFPHPWNVVFCVSSSLKCIFFCVSVSLKCCFLVFPVLQNVVFLLFWISWNHDLSVFAVSCFLKCCFLVFPVLQNVVFLLFWISWNHDLSVFVVSCFLKCCFWMFPVLWMMMWIVFCRSGFSEILSFSFFWFLGNVKKQFSNVAWACFWISCILMNSTVTETKWHPNFNTFNLCSFSFFRKNGHRSST